MKLHNFSKIINNLHRMIEINEDFLAQAYRFRLMHAQKRKT